MDTGSSETMAKDIPDSLQLILYEESGYQCAHCGHREGLDLTIHHLKPRSQGGPTEYGNLIVLCHNCHHRVEQTHTLNPRDLRRIKEYLVHRLFTQAGVNALKIAYRNPLKKVVVAPYLVQHLVDMGFLEFDEDVSSVTWEDEPELKAAEIVTLATYTLTNKGSDIAEQWLSRSDDEDTE